MSNDDKSGVSSPKKIRSGSTDLLSATPEASKDVASVSRTSDESDAVSDGGAGISGVAEVAASSSEANAESVGIFPKSELEESESETQLEPACASAALPSTSAASSDIANKKEITWMDVLRNNKKPYIIPLFRLTMRRYYRVKCRHYRDDDDEDEEEEDEGEENEEGSEADNDDDDFSSSSSADFDEGRDARPDDRPTWQSIVTSNGDEQLIGAVSDVLRGRFLNDKPVLFIKWRGDFEKVKLAMRDYKGDEERPSFLQTLDFQKATAADFRKAIFDGLVEASETPRWPGQQIDRFPRPIGESAIVGPSNQCEAFMRACWYMCQEKYWIDLAKTRASAIPLASIYLLSHRRSDQTKNISYSPTEDAVKLWE